MNNYKTHIATKYILATALSIIFTVVSTQTVSAAYIPEPVDINGLANVGSFSQSLLVKAGDELGVIALSTESLNSADWELKTYVYSEDKNALYAVEFTGLPKKATPLDAREYGEYEYVLFDKGLWRTPKTSLYAWEQVADVQGEVLAKTKDRLVVLSSEGISWFTKNGEVWRHKKIHTPSEYTTFFVAAMPWKGMLYGLAIVQDVENPNGFVSTILKSKNGRDWKEAFQGIDVFASHAPVFPFGIFEYRGEMYVTVMDMEGHTHWYVTSGKSALVEQEQPSELGDAGAVAAVIGDDAVIAYSDTQAMISSDFTQWSSAEGFTDIGAPTYQRHFHGKKYILTNTAGVIGMYMITQE